MVTYDEVKREANITNHGFDFVGSDAVFAGFTITREDGRDADHIISIRKAEKHEKRIYWKNYPS